MDRWFGQKKQFDDDSLGSGEICIIIRTIAEFKSLLVTASSSKARCEEKPKKLHAYIQINTFKKLKALIVWHFCLTNTNLSNINNFLKNKSLH